MILPKSHPNDSAALAKYSRHTIILVPNGCHLMLPAGLNTSDILNQGRFIRLDDKGGTFPLPMQAVSTSTIAVDTNILNAIDLDYYTKNGAVK
jgi:hypothetical protein